MHNRRSFLRNLSLSAATLSLPAKSLLRAQGVNSQIRVAGIGVGGRGGGLFKEALSDANARLVALCDVDPKRLAAGKSSFEKAQAETGQTISTYTDIRRLLESKEIDAIMIATPNHWHTLAAIWGIQSGKDVYVEKPVSHTLWEGRQLVAASNRYGKIVQCGQQSRSSGGLKAAAQWLQASPLGSLRYAYGTCYKRRPSIGKVPSPQGPPEGLDMDLWCGPAAHLPVYREKLHYDWHWIWDYGNGDFGNQGVHQADIARWFMGENHLPHSVLSVGGRLGYVDDGETPNTQLVAYPYERAPLYFEVRGLPQNANSKEMDTRRGAQTGVILQYQNGHVLIPNYTSATAFDSEGNPVHVFGTAQIPAGRNIPRTEGEKETHVSNWLKAVASRNRSGLSCPAEEGHLSAGLCHLAGISHRMGRTESPDALKARFKEDSVAADALGQMLEHLRLNAVDPAKTPLTLGAHLPFNPQTLTFPENPTANALLHRRDRKGFEIPNLIA
ncbi:MAG: hypothetical protein RLZZ142_913 [Verrucomicrobiota bacterium]